MTYLSLNKLQRNQNQLKLSLIKYSLDEEWQSSKLIARLRDRIYPRLPQGLFDPQDLEHQVLFRLTTYSPEEITDEVIDSVIREQSKIIEYRLNDIEDREYLFRGLSGRSKDLNVNERLELKNDKGRLYATGFGRTIDVEFKKITDSSIIKLFTEKLHYIHSERSSGDAFGFYFANDDIPWGVETVEWGLNIKKYKRDALLAHGIDPGKAVEVTRLYLLPGSPKNAISILDGLVAKYYKNKDMEAMYTTTMPMYAKIKGATTSGGMRNVLLVKELSHKFVRSKIQDEDVYIHDVSARSEQIALKTSSKFPTLLTVETFMRLNHNRDISPMRILKGKTIFVNSINRRGERLSELRFSIESLSGILENICASGARHISTSHICDEFWHSEETKDAVRLRKIITGASVRYEASSKYRVSKESHIRSVVDDILYRGDSYANAVSAIKIKSQDYRPAETLERVRSSYRLSEKTTLRLDVCPFGVFLTVSGDADRLSLAAESLGLDAKKSIQEDMVNIYRKWCTQCGLPKLSHIRFGLGNADE